MKWLRTLRPVATAARIKSENRRHDWRITATGNLADIGAADLHTTSARCASCGEVADGFTAEWDRFLLLRQWGCVRGGFTGRFEPGDHVLVARGTWSRLDVFANYLPDGRLATWNHGGRSYVLDAAEVQPRLVEAVTPPAAAVPA